MTFSLCSSVVVHFFALRFLSARLPEQTAAALPLLLSAVRDNGFSAILLVSLVRVISGEAWRKKKKEASFEHSLGEKESKRARERKCRMSQSLGIWTGISVSSVALVF